MIARLPLAAATMLMCAACSDLQFDNTGVEARAMPAAQSAAGRALRLPRMRPAESRRAAADDRMVTVRVRVLMQGVELRDTAVQARSFNPDCQTTFVDTAVVRHGNAVIDAVVWVEGPTRTLITPGLVVPQRPSVRMQECRLSPRLQVAAPGSTLMMVMGDSLVESLVVVPSSVSAPADTITFLMNGQLVPVRQRADSSGVVGVYSLRLPWARAFVAIAPPASVALSDSGGHAHFTLDGRGTTTIVRAWHPSLGIVSAKVSLRPNQPVQDVTLTFRR
jgi:hypothetical protein